MESIIAEKKRRTDIKTGSAPDSNITPRHYLN